MYNCTWVQNGKKFLKKYPNYLRQMSALKR